MSQRLISTLSRSRPYVCLQCIHVKLLSTQAWRAHPKALHASARVEQKHDSLLAELEMRGLVNQIAGDRNNLDALLRKSKVGIYAGVDPTAPSLHLGHLLPIMVLFWASLYGQQAISLVGSATARVGDPSGRLTSRVKTAESVHTSNALQMVKQTSGLWVNAMKYAKRWGHTATSTSHARVKENSEWLDGLGIFEFLEVLASGVRVGAMLGRDTVRNKMEKGDGMSFSELTYPLLQAWDWWHMYSTMNVQIQVGGSDQYGNIVAGMDAVKYIAQTQPTVPGQIQSLDNASHIEDELVPMGLTVPLLTTASGEKFGKSAGNAIWLDPSMTTPFDLYGFLLRSSDEDVERYLKLFTFVPVEQITTTMAEHNLNPGRRKAQHLLASEVLELVHGRETALRTRTEHETSRNPSLQSLAGATEDGIGADAATSRIRLPRCLVHNTPLSRVLFHAGLVATKSEGARLVAKGGVYVATSHGNAEQSVWEQVKDEKSGSAADFVFDSLLMLRLGKWKVRVIAIVDDSSVTTKSLEA